MIITTLFFIVGNKFHRILLLSLNDSSLGFYRIFDHIHRKVPKIVETRKRLESMDKRIDTANSDIEDVRKQVHEIERIETFCNIADMIKQSLEILDLKKSQQ
jgi:hypothetical protein